MNDRGLLVTFWMSSLSKITSLEKTSQFKLVEDSNSTGVIELLMHDTIPITLYYILLSFRDTMKISN